MSGKWRSTVKGLLTSDSKRQEDLVHFEEDDIVDLEPTVISDDEIVHAQNNIFMSQPPLLRQHFIGSLFAIDESFPAAISVSSKKVAKAKRIGTASGRKERKQGAKVSASGNKPNPKTNQPKRKLNSPKTGRSKTSNRKKKDSSIEIEQAGESAYEH